ncbi:MULTISPECIES: YciI family protein [unclassified Variovorax]|uniref:YciI family protein n=1 Tax=unclassified Variovorax TaxID=663243 RepID=UPI001BD3EE12|nr:MULTISPECIES: YciI family protein [unclassified Variovorax]
MPFVILSLDKPDSQALRQALRPAHLDYLTARQDKMLAGGALLDADGQAIGSLIILDAPDAQSAQAFAGEDPFGEGQLFASVQVMPWRQAFFDRRRTK